MKQPRFHFICQEEEEEEETPLTDTSNTASTHQLLCVGVWPLITRLAKNTLPFQFEQNSAHG